MKANGDQRTQSMLLMAPILSNFLYELLFLLRLSKVDMFFDDIEIKKK